MPVLNIVNVMTALTFGYTVFAEVPRHTPLLLGVEAVAMACIAYGLWLLVRAEEDFLEPEHVHEAELGSEDTATSL